jgi:hypothetical protein
MRYYVSAATTTGLTEMRSGHHLQCGGGQRQMNVRQVGAWRCITSVFQRLSRFGRSLRECTSSIFGSSEAMTLEVAYRLYWLMLKRRKLVWTAGITIAVFLLIGRVSEKGASRLWNEYHANREDLAPLFTLAAGVAVAAVALARHFAQTEADRQRRITETFGKAIEQLGSDKPEVRLGGIYLLERISKESLDDYWSVMETLTAFVRECSRRNEVERTTRDFEQFVEAGRPDGESAEQGERDARLATEIAAVLTVIKRRSKRRQAREVINAWYLDLSGAVLKRADLFEVRLGGINLRAADLEGANLRDAILGGADLRGARLRDAILDGADLGSTDLNGANLNSAHLNSAHLRGADLSGARLREADLFNADLIHANLTGADLRGADLRYAEGLSAVQLETAHGDGATRLPEGVARPAHWPPETSDNAKM